MNNGYIYIRTNEYWETYNAVKLGKTTSIIDREQTYITSEINKGSYIMIIEIDLIILDNIEKQLQLYFTKLNLHIKFNAGTEFYNKDIIELIIPYFDSNNIKYNILSLDEINNLIRNQYINEPDETIKSNNEIYIPRDYQQTIINIAYEYFQSNDKGLLIIPCGVGKTLISLWITQELKTNTKLIGVPNILLLKQWENIICVLFPDIPYLIVSGGITIDDIIIFLKTNNKQCIIITTYSSAHKIYTATKQYTFTFSIKIFDEVHHLTTNNMLLSHTTKKYIQMLNIPSVKQLSLTATIKELDKCNDNINIVSNNNIEYFGDIIDRKCLLWAINKNIICDYVIQTIITNEEELKQQLNKFNIIEENDKRLFLSAFASLKSIYIEHSHHLLIYSNNMNNSLKLIQYIKMLLDDNYFDIPKFYYSNYHSEMKSIDQNKIIHNFENAKFGIITCVYCLGEGWDFPLLDGVVFAENMSSNIRIVQSALRASRKNKHQPNKITKIILPILNKDDWLENNINPDLKKVREVIYQMGLEDETITQKIKVFNIKIKPQKPQRLKGFNKIIDTLGDYDNELTEKLKLKTIKRTALTTTYEKARQIIADKNIKSKQYYYELCDKDNRLSKEPEIVFKGKFTNWIDYLSIERIYYDLATCIKTVNKVLILHNEIKAHYLDLSIICKKLCELDDKFPPNELWCEYYNVKDLRDIITITNKKKKMGVIL